MVDLHNGILFSSSKQEHHEFYRVMDRTRKYHPERGNLAPKGHAQYILTDKKILANTGYPQYTPEAQRN